ncbi:MAG: BadF/BadG/BcrA/BcrD ATPase family protein [Pseudomonadota bacterium]
MAEDSDTQYIAVDGGGSGCRLVLVRESDTVFAEAGPANVSTDPIAAVDRIRHGLSLLAERSGQSMEDLMGLPAYFALAGVTGPAIAARVNEQLGFGRAVVEEDKKAAVAGALGDVDGAVVHCGTGSFLGIQCDAKVRLAGGWGAELGDEASAQWVGRAALAETLRCADGLALETPLTAGILASFGTTDAILAFARDAEPSAFGRLAPQVTALASEGDSLARQILQSGADYITGTLTALEWSPDTRLCLTGGIGPSYRPYLPPEFRAVLADPLGTPTDGAVRLGRRLFQLEKTNQ